jgi:hypothetical protein
MGERAVPHDCPRFGGCRAPLCPLDSELGSRSWFPGEPICARREFTAIPLVTNQRKLARRHADGVFTGAMLSSKLGRIGRGMAGLDADNELDPAAETAWLSKRKARQRATFNLSGLAKARRRVPTAGGTSGPLTGPMEVPAH